MIAVVTPQRIFSSLCGINFVGIMQRFAFLAIGETVRVVPQHGQKVPS